MASAIKKNSSRAAGTQRLCKKDMAAVMLTAVIRGQEVIGGRTHALVCNDNCQFADAGAFAFALMQRPGRITPGRVSNATRNDLLRGYFFTSGQSLSLSGFAASSAGIVATSL